MENASPGSAQPPLFEHTSSSTTQAPQVVYVSRECKIKKVSGCRNDDKDTADHFVDNVKSLISARKMSQVEQTDFLLSLLESAAKEEVKLHPRAERNTSDKICSILLEAFGERRTTPQLLKSFYERKQTDTETLRQFSQAMLEIYNLPILRKELKRMIRSNSRLQVTRSPRGSSSWGGGWQKFHASCREKCIKRSSFNHTVKQRDG